MLAGTSCRSCHAIIIWAVTTAGNRIPVDFRQVPGGNIELEEWRPGEHPQGRVVAHVVKPDPKVERYVSHFATCPDAQRWKRR